MGEGQGRAQDPARHGVGAVHMAQCLLLGAVEDPPLSLRGPLSASQASVRTALTFSSATIGQGASRSSCSGSSLR